MDINKISLEKEAYDLCVLYDANIKPDFTVTEVRMGFDYSQINLIPDLYIYPCFKSEEQFKLDSNTIINVTIVTPQPPLTTNEQQSNKLLPIIFYLHGGGFVAGSSKTHDKIICELSNRTNSVVIAPNYSRAPEHKYPVALEECYSILLKCISESKQRNWDSNNIIISGDSAGGNLAVVLSLLLKIKNGPKISKCLLYCPVLDSNYDTISYQNYKKGFYMTMDNMKWFWNHYTNNENEQNQFTVCPLKATIEQLKDFPQTCIISAEVDVLLTESELFSEKLKLANVPVYHEIYKSITHNFTVVSQLDKTLSCRAAMDYSISFINK